MPRPSFSARVIRWQRASGRHDLPWQGTRDAYRIWLSEVMLQQTQVATALPYYERFVARFPTVEDLATASEDDVLALWSGLGYYARARNLHRAACAVAGSRRGFPVTFDALLELPGVGRSTAAAVAAFASGERRAILDGNVKRVLARHAGIGGDPSQASVLARLWEAAEARLPARGIEPYTQGLMDIGATLCTARNPRCGECPVAADCVARTTDRIDELPGKKRRAAAKRKRIAMLVIVSRGEVLLEKRPSPGIWGGLWSLPEADASKRPKDAQPLAPFSHAFTHFTLEVTPWLVRPRSRTDRPGTMWLSLDDLAGAALPSPVRKLLGALRPPTSDLRPTGSTAVA